MDRRPSSSTGVYRRRRPERTALYRALAHHFETFLQVYEERFQPTFGHLRHVVQKAVYRFLDCGVLERGFARIRCADCRRDFVVAFSCQMRCVCPSCHQKRELLGGVWAEELLPGAIGFLHTAGEFLQFHPHLHVLLTDGGWLPDGTFRHFLYLDTRHLEELFRSEVLRMLQDKGLIDESVVTNMLSWPNSGFSAHAATETRSTLPAFDPHGAVDREAAEAPGKRGP